MRIIKVYFFSALSLFLIGKLDAGAPADFPANPLNKPGWELTFHDEFDRPVLDDYFWFSSYRAGRGEYLRRIGKDARWYDDNAHCDFGNGTLKLRVDRTRPWRPTPITPCVSCITTSDHRIGKSINEIRIFDKFSQKYGYFEMRAKCVKGSGWMCAFWLHQVDPRHQEFTLDGERNEKDGVVEIDIFEQRGKCIGETNSQIDYNVHFTTDGHFLDEVPGDLSETFHIYAMQWQEGKIQWFFDNRLVRTYEGPTPPGEMFLLAALFHYEGWLGKIDPQGSYPRDFEIDYIRVYRQKP